MLKWYKVGFGYLAITSNIRIFAIVTTVTVTVITIYEILR